MHDFPAYHIQGRSPSLTQYRQAATSPNLYKISLHNQGSSCHMQMCIRAIQPHLLQIGSVASPRATLGCSLILTNRLATATHHCECHHTTRPTCIYTCSHCMHATQLACTLATWGRLPITGHSLVCHQTPTLAPTTCMRATFHAAQRALAQPGMQTPHWPLLDSRTTIHNRHAILYTATQQSPCSN